MKYIRFNLIIRIILLLSIPQISNAQNIIGKWECPKEFLNSVGFINKDVHGYYLFKKNGKFSLRISGTRQTGYVYRGEYYDGREFRTYKTHGKFCIMSVKVKGRYEIVDGRITTYVKPKDSKIYVSPGLNQPEFNGREGVVEQQWKRMDDRHYNIASTVAEFQENTIKTERRGLWTWTKASMQFNKDTLTVGKFIKLVRR